MKTRGLVLVVVLAVCGTLLSATAWINLPGQINYVVNPNSFVTGFSALGGDPTQAIQYAAQHWAAYGGTYKFFKRTGFTTTPYSCTLGGPNVVQGVAGFRPGEMSCTTVAETIGPCWAGNWVVEVYGCSNRSLTYPVRNPPGSTGDFHLTMVHEFGHLLLSNGSGVDQAGHLAPTSNPDDVTTMASGASVSTTSTFTGFGTSDITALGGPGPAAWGNGYLNAGVNSVGSIGSPVPTGFQAFQAPAASNRWVGIGGFDYQVAADEVFAASRVTPEPHLAEAGPLWGGGLLASVATNQVFATPSLVRDTTRNQWWMIARDGGHNNYAHLFRRTSATSWIDLGAIPDIVSRYPVGAAYSWAMDRIVVVWANSRGDVPGIVDSSVPCTVSVGGWSQPFGCQGEYLVTLLDPVSGTRISTSRFLTAQGATKPGYLGLGAPSVVCEADICEVFVTSRDAARSLISWAFVPSQTGILAYYAQVAQGGSTDFAVSTSTLPAGSGNRVLVQAVLGRDDRNSYFRTRQSYWNSWSSWQNSHPGIEFLATPRVARNNQNNFVLVGSF